MTSVCDHPNVYSSCVALLSLQGWTVSIEPSEYEDEEKFVNTYHAERNGVTIVADDPLRLLGLATLDQYHQPHDGIPYWWVIKEPQLDLLERLEDEALEQSFLQFLKEKPEKAKDILRSEMENFEKDPGVSVEHRIGISTATLIRLRRELNL